VLIKTQNLSALFFCGQAGRYSILKADIVLFAIILRSNLCPK